MAKRAYRHDCAECGAVLDYPSWHCAACVADKHVCRMCGNELSGRQLEFCSSACKVASHKKRHEAGIANGNLPLAIGEFMTALEPMMQQQADMFTELDARNQQRHEELLLALQPPKDDDLPQDVIGLLTVIAENSSTETPMIRKMANALEEIADRLKRLENQPRTTTPAAQQPQLAPRATVSDDDLLASLEITAATYDEDNNSSYNFILGMAGVAAGNAEFNLPPEVYEYAVRKGLIKPAADTQPSGPRKMDTPEIAAPDFDDFDIPLEIEELDE